MLISVVEEELRYLKKALYIQHPQNRRHNPSSWILGNILRKSPWSAVREIFVCFLYKPNSSTTALFANDGGVFYTNNIGAADTASVISHASKGYNVTQFYAAAIHPEIGKNFFLAGSQDNGTHLNKTSWARVRGGDGMDCGMDPGNELVMYASIYYGDFDKSNRRLSWKCRTRKKNVWNLLYQLPWRKGRRTGAIIRK